MKVQRGGQLFLHIITYTSVEAMMEVVNRLQTFVPLWHEDTGELKISSRTEELFFGLDQFDHMRAAELQSDVRWCTNMVTSTEAVNWGILTLWWRQFGGGTNLKITQNNNTFIDISDYLWHYCWIKHEFDFWCDSSVIKLLFFFTH